VYPVHGRPDRPLHGRAGVQAGGGLDGVLLTDVTEGQFGRAHAGPGHGEALEVEGIVKRRSHARLGEANGVDLDSGDFVHMKPDGMKRVGLQIGQRTSMSLPLGCRPSREDHPRGPPAILSS
jgi:hypothetical protein